MRTKRKNYNYDSDDFENGDYDQEDFEGDDDDYGDEDQVEESGGDSDYEESNGNPNKSTQNIKASKVRATKEQDLDQDETYEDEDPFSPEIDQILADRQTEVPLAQVSTQVNQTSSRTQRNQFQTPQSRVQNWYLVKFTEQSYLHVRWMEESEIEKYSYRAKQKIRRYYNAKEKKRILQEQLQRQAVSVKPQKNHHFSDDEEEDEEEEDAAIKGIPLPILPMPSDDALEPDENEPPRIRVESPDGEDLTQFFDKNYVVVERILSTTLLFPVIHPKQAKQIKGKWQDDCLKVVNVLANFRKNNVPIGLAFAEQLDPEKMYQQPTEFWNDLGLVFKNCRTYYKSTKRGLRKQCDALRCMALHLYNDWYQEQRNRFITGVALPPEQPQQQSRQPTQVNQNLSISTNLTPQPPYEQKKDSTIVNLSSLLRTQKSTLDQQRKQQDNQFQVPQLPQPQQPIPQPNFQNQFQQPTNQLNQQMQNQMSNQNYIDQQSYMQQLQQVNQQQQQQQALQQQNQMDMFNFQNSQMAQNNIVPSIKQAQQPPSLPSLTQLMGNQNQNQQMLQNQQNMMGNAPNMMGNQFGQSQQNDLNALASQMDMSRMLQLPSMNQLQEQMMQNQMGNSMQGNPFFPNQSDPSLDFNLLQQLQSQQDRSINLLNQMMAQGMNPAMMTPENLALLQMMGHDMGMGMGMGRQNFGLGQMPFQLPSLQQQNNPFSLPSLNSLGQMNFNPTMGSMDPYQMAMMSMMQGGNQMFNPIMQQQQQNMLRMPNFTSTMNTGDAYNEMSMMLGNLQQQTLGSMNPTFNPFGQNDFSSIGMGNQIPGFDQMMGLSSNNNAMRGMGMPQFPGQNTPQPIKNFDPNLIQPDNLDQYNDRQQDPPVPPCIMDPGQYDLSWLLEPGENPQDLLTTPYLTQEEIERAVKNKSFVDQLFLVKWKGLSYSQATWEPESTFKYIYDEKIQDYNRFNRSLDQFQRDRLDQLIKNHKKMLRVTEKKYQNKRMDPNQEAFLALQEAKINRQLLNAKIQEIMGDAFYSFIQYSEQIGIVPQFKKPTQRLKDYQLIGLNWLIRAWHEHRNVVLADEMGLGKTIMTLSLFDHLNKVYKLRGPYLILAPLTTLEHWKRIADEWTTLNSVLYYDPGSAEGRNEIRYWEWFYTDVKYNGQITQKSELFKFNIIITSFEVFMQDLNPILQEVPFIYIVVDEAHRLKNKQAKTLKLLKDHPCKRILLLTGTPVQNNTKELWTLLNYIEPEKFNSMDAFLEQYGNLETYDQIQKLHTMLKPHFLRRLKEEVDNSIPPLQETVIEVGLTTLQNTYYKGIYGENRMMLAKFGTNSIKTSQLNNIDVQLRKCCNHLFLLKGVEEELTKDCRNEQDVYKKLLESSGKLMLLDKFIEKFKEENHKMLIFSQFKRMLDIIEFYLKMKAVPYEKLTGSVKTQDRINAIQRFNDDKSFGVFLLTTRAGGLGINLTSARVVIIFDSDWNPQNDLQAIARAHRIGQKFEVQVYRLITSKTYEEQMFERASKKLGMEQALFSKGAFHQDDADLASMYQKGLTELKQDSKEIENLLKYGAYAFIDHDGEGGNDDPNVNKDIDEILATGKKKEFTYTKGLYTLQKSTFNASKYENLPDVNDPDFWNKVLPFESIISISVLEKKFKKEKKELAKNDKLLKEFFKDLEIVFNDFMDAKFDTKTSTVSKKQFEADEEKLREILKKLIKLTGIKLWYVEKCKEWLRDMLRTNKRKKPSQFIKDMEGGQEHHEGAQDEDEDQQVEEDDIILYDSDDQIRNRILRKRNPAPTQPQKQEQEESGPVLNKRGRKPKHQVSQQLQSKPSGSFEESDGMEEDEEDDDEVYGEEEDKDYQYHEGKQSNRKQYNDDDMGDSEDEAESRYGLRGPRKRQKTGKETDNFNSGQQQFGQNLQNKAVLKANQKMNEQLIKRNEKNGIVCAYCLHPEQPSNQCTYFCTGYCQRFFHEDCKDTLFIGSETKRNTPKLGQGWKCDDCLDNKAACFCCKQKGQILLFPKKGKPKAAGYSDQQQPSFIMDEDDMPDDEMFGINNHQQEEIKGDEVEDEDIEIDLEQDINDVKEEQPPQQQDQQNDQTPEDQQNEQAQDKNEVEGKEVQDKTHSQEHENVQDTPSPSLQKETSTKIVLIIAKANEKPLTQPEVKSPTKANGTSSPELEPNDKRFVVRCTLGGCFKYYHVDCVYKNKNVSCINSMKVQRFRCPLHYCEICQASGDSVLIVQCVTCPTAYHLKCLPQDIKAIRLTKKYIICGKHNLSQDDFPKYEEKSVGQPYAREVPTSTMSLQNMGSQGGNLGLKSDKKKKRSKKKGKVGKIEGDCGDESMGDDMEFEQQSTIQNSQLKRDLFANSKQQSSVVIRLDEPSKKQKNDQVSFSSSMKNVSNSGPKPLFAVIRGQRNK